eukprot:1159148-Pelagomonas_calceolata.AAC.24
MVLRTFWAALAPPQTQGDRALLLESEVGIGRDPAAPPPLPPRSPLHSLPVVGPIELPLHLQVDGLPYQMPPAFQHGKTREDVLQPSRGSMPSKGKIESTPKDGCSRPMPRHLHLRCLTSRTNKKGSLAAHPCTQLAPKSDPS